MLLKKIILVRHGQFEGMPPNDSLSDRGKTQIENLGEYLVNRRLVGEKIAGISSTAKRSRETAEILRRHLNTRTFETCECFYSSGGGIADWQLSEAFQVIADKEASCDTVVITTHYEFLKYFPTIWGERRGFTIAEPENPTPASAIILDAETGRTMLLKS